MNFSLTRTEFFHCPLTVIIPLHNKYISLQLNIIYNPSRSSMILTTDNNSYFMMQFCSNQTHNLWTNDKNIKTFMACSELCVLIMNTLLLSFCCFYYRIECRLKYKTQYYFAVLYKLVLYIFYFTYIICVDGN